MKKYYPIVIVAVILVGSFYAVTMYKENEKETIRWHSFASLYPETSTAEGIGLAVSQKFYLSEKWNQNVENEFRGYVFILNEYKEDKEVLITCYIDDIQVPFCVKDKKGILHSVFLRGKKITKFKIDVNLEEGEHYIQLILIRKDDLKIDGSIYQTKIVCSPKYFIKAKE